MLINALILVHMLLVAHFVAFPKLWDANTDIHNVWMCIAICIAQTIHTMIKRPNTKNTSYL